jgi:hypothetical protein
MKYKDIIAHVNKILSEYTMRLTLRQVYYRLVANFGLPNTRSNYNCLSAQLVKARENNDVNEDRIEDRTRGFLGGDGGYHSPDRFAESYKSWFLKAWDSYTRNLWQDQNQFVIVWVEKDALSRVISDVADNWRVITAPSKGYASYTFIKSAIDKLPSGDKNIMILHFGDHDPSGIDMTRDLGYRFQRYAPDKRIEIRRCALTFEQVKQYNLDPNPVKQADTRSEIYRTMYGESCWELDAIEPNELQRLVLQAIELYIDKDQWQASVQQEADDKEELKEQFEKYREALEDVE